MSDGNTGDWNSGTWNSGTWNSGDWNSGNWNSGTWNSGNGNSGNGNSGTWNSGNWNSGTWNSGDWNSGIFNTDEPFMRCFNKETKIKRSDFLMPYIELKLNYWISQENMTKEEKKEHPEYKTTEGFLKTVDYKTAWRVAWEDATEEKRKEFLDLPNFDAEIFEEITGINTLNPEESVEIDGKKFSLSTIKEALKNHTDFES